MTRDKAQMFDVKRDRTGDVADLITNAVHVLNERTRACTGRDWCHVRIQFKLGASRWSAWVLAER